MVKWIGVSLLEKNSGEYVPDRGDYVWLNFDQTVGHEQQGKRPVIVLSVKGYNRHGMMLCMPITSKASTHPFAVLFSENGLSGSILCDQIKSVDWKKRTVTLIGRSSGEILAEAAEKINLLLPR